MHNPAADDAFDDDDDRIGLLQEQDGAMHNDSIQDTMNMTDNESGQNIQFLR